jgi:hypothetical protein
VHFFTFGGALETVADSHREMVVYVLQSTAPILELTGRDETFADNLAAEARVLMGELEEKLAEALIRRALDRSPFQMDPFRLYVAVCYTVFKRYEQAPALQRTYSAFFHALRREQKWLADQGKWPNVPPKLEEIFPRCLVDV